MSYQTPITIKQALERIHRHDYVLPSIQREFVWTPDQVCQLFDSLLRGYPIGTFLFWDVKADTAANFVFYDVMRHFHEAKNRHNPRIDDFTPRPVIAILDGQQRLSALNIGLRGSYAAKVPRKRLDPYPVKHLYLDLCYEPGPEAEVEFRFAFLTDGEAIDDNPTGETSECWYLVSDILGIADATDIFGTYIQPEGLGNHPTAFKVLNQLHRSVHERPVVAYFVEEEQSLAKVLDIFVRVNSGGTVLSKSDLLLSIATAQFTGRDAREAVHGLVDDLNGISHGFNFSKDMVLKTGMILSGLPDPGFKVENFTKDNMRRLDEAWDGIANSLRLAARLAASFGFSSRTLSGNSVLIPVAHYLHHRGKDEGYLSITNNDDHEVIKGWMLRSLIKPGVWGSGLDTLLKQLMRVIVGTSAGPFPVKELEAEMARAGKDLTFTPALIDDLVETPYKNKRVFALLSMLYPGTDVRNEFHEDHVFPKSKFTKANLVKAGIDESEVGEFRDRADRLPNLQLLDGGVNIKKQAMLPLDWATQHFPNEQARQMWLAGHDLHDLPAALAEFGEFYEARRNRLVHRLRDLLGADGTSAPTSPVIAEPTPQLIASTAADRPQDGRRRTFARTLPDLMQLGRVAPGEVFAGSYGGRTFEVEVTEAGTLRSGAGEFRTPSGAAKELTGQVAVNGWAFWRTEDDEPIGDLR